MKYICGNGHKFSNGRSWEDVVYANFKYGPVCPQCRQDTLTAQEHITKKR